MGKTSLKDKTAVITGASSGIGRATALAFSELGAKLTLASRNVEAIEELAAQIRTGGGNALVVPVDVTQKQQVEEMIQRSHDHWGKIDIVVANAGQYIRSPILGMDDRLIEESMAVNFYGGYYTLMAALPSMLKRGRGQLVLVSTVDAKKGLPLDAPYVAAKFALTGFAEVLRQELHGSGISVTTIFPGRIDTPMLNDLEVPRISAKISPEAVAKSIVRACSRRAPAEVIIPFQARLLVYLNVFSPRMADWAARVFRLEGWQKKAPINL
jgi:NADP-dependent 3-hydroxy acid dehydrogenase YdfG